MVTYLVIEVGFEEYRLFDINRKKIVTPLLDVLEVENDKRIQKCIKIISRNNDVNSVKILYGDNK